MNLWIGRGKDMHFCGSERQKQEARKDWARKVCRPRCAHHETLIKCKKEWVPIWCGDGQGCKNFEERKLEDYK